MFFGSKPELIFWYEKKIICWNSHEPGIWLHHTFRTKPVWPWQISKTYIVQTTFSVTCYCPLDIGGYSVGNRIRMTKTCKKIDILWWCDRICIYNNNSKMIPLYLKKYLQMYRRWIFTFLQIVSCKVKQHSI